VYDPFGLNPSQTPPLCLQRNPVAAFPVHSSMSEQHMHTHTHTHTLNNLTDLRDIHLLSAITSTDFVGPEGSSRRRRRRRRHRLICHMPATIRMQNSASHGKTTMGLLNTRTARQKVELIHDVIIDKTF